MTFDSNLELAQQESLPEFYTFVAGETTYYYTTYNQELVFESRTHTPASIQRSGFKVDDKFGTVKVTIQSPINDLFAQYIVNTPLMPVSVRICRALKSDLTDYVILFSGMIKVVAVKNMEAQASCESKSHMLNTKMPKIIYQAYCNHDVFDSQCGLDDQAYRVNSIIRSVDFSKYYADEFALHPDDYFRGGILKYGSDIRFITGHTTDCVDLHVPFDDSVGFGTTVEAYPGCNGSPEMCVDRYSNLVNYLGMPYIPSHNPAVWGF